MWTSPDPPPGRPANLHHQPWLDYSPPVPAKPWLSSVPCPARLDSVHQSDTLATTEVPVPEPSELARRYRRSGDVLWVVDTTVGFLIPGLLLWSGFSARMRDWATRIGRGGWFRTIAVYGVLFIVLTALLGLPLSWYQEFVREHAYGLSNQSLSRWLGDWLKALGLSCLVAPLLLWIPYWMLGRSPRRWWLWTGLSAIPLSVLALIVIPLWVEPLFNQFGPLENKVLEAQILALASRAGIDRGRVFEVKKSVDTKTVNAYVTGFGGTKRIVLWDTILARLTPREILFVVGHEMGHFVLHHTLAVILGATVLATLSLYTVHRLAGHLIGRHAPRFGFDRLDDVASLPLLLLLSSVVSFGVMPVVLAGSRWMEHEADRFGLELTRDNRAAALTFVRLQEENLDLPRPGLLYRLWRGSHPPLAERIEFANRYRPWATGGTLRYGHLFRPAADP
jgi:STE24 endopeptidase